MRRLWAYLLIAFSALVISFASLPTLIKGFSSNGDHRLRRQFTFQLTEREKEDDEDEVKKLTADSAKEMAKIMEERLISYDVESYDIQTSGNDVVTVSFGAENVEKYQQIVTYLTFSGSFALMNNQSDVVEASQFRNGNAYLKSVTVNEYPEIILPIKTDYTEWDTLIQNAQDNPVTVEGQEDGDSREVARLFLIYNYQKGENYQILSENNTLENKTLLTFDFAPDSTDELFYDSNKNSLSQICGYQDKNGNGYADPIEVQSAFNQADFLLHLFNASSLDYEVKCIKGITSGTEVWLDPKVEAVITEDKVVWNNTLTAAVAAVVVVSLLLVVFYRLGAISAVTTTVLSVLSGFMFMILAGLEYNMLAVAALVAVGVISLVSSIVYLNKLKEDAYRGHTLKKANTEASKKSLLPIIDIHFVGIVVGLMVYLLGGSALHSFGSILTFGTIISLIVNTLGLKGLMWLATNTTGLIGKYEYFGIDSANVPNHMAEEKQRFYGPYAEKDFTVKRKPVSFVALGAFVLSLVGVIVAGSLNGGTLIKAKAASAIRGEIYVQNKIKVIDDDSKSKLDENTLKDQILSYIEIEDKNDNGETVYNSLLTYSNLDFDTFDVKESKTVESVTTNYSTTYYVVQLKKIISLDTNAKLSSEPVSDARALSEVLEDVMTDPTIFSGSEETVVSVKTVTEVVPVASPDWSKITLATFIAILIVTLYLTLRYRLSRGLATLLFPIVSSAIALGITVLFGVIGMSITASAAVSVPLVTLVSYFFMILFMNREREMILDDKNRDNTYEHRVEVSKKALGMAATPIFAAAVIGVYVFINFFGFGIINSSYLYLVSILASLAALGLVIVLFVPVSNFLYKLFSKITINTKPRERKNKKVVTKKSAEPEEAIFIGIND